MSNTEYLIAILAATAFYYFWKHLFKLYFSKTCKVVFDWNDPCRVGETVTFNILFPRSGSDEYTRNRASDILNKIFIEICCDSQKINTIKEPRGVDDHIVISVKFSVQQSGVYKIHIRYDGSSVLGSPFIKTFWPGSIDPKKTTFLRPSPTLSLVAYRTVSFEVQPKDRFGNICRSSDFKLDNFSFSAKIADESRQDESLSVDHYSYFFAQNFSKRIKLSLDCFKPGFYNGVITYDGQIILNGTFNMVVMDCFEETKMQSILLDNPSWTYHEAKLLAIGTEIQKKMRKIYIYVSPKLFYVREYLFKIIPIRVATYRISSMTKITMIIDNKDEKTYVLSIFDGVVPRITLEMNSSNARIVIGMFSHFLQRRLGGTETFEGKQRVFYEELLGTFKDLRISFVELNIERSDIVTSTMNATKSFRANNWSKSFRIKFIGEQGIDTGGLRREWLELLCVNMFQNKKDGMFSSLGNSRLVHPNPVSSRHQKWTIKHYQFAGKIVGKCLFECACGDAFKQMVNARFSRSFFAQIIGLRPEYKYFEQDDPELYLGKIKYIIDNDMDTMEPQITFSEEEYSETGKLIQTIDLVPNGSKKVVTNENKGEYLNALANYRLGTTVKKEIEAFLKRLHEIVPDELLTNFDENELELLLCGKSEFNLEDLKRNHLDGGWVWDPNYNRIISWFFQSISNMTDDERARLLQFTTGSSLLPHGGFKMLNPKFKITVASTFGKLPTAHTCFNQICLSDQHSFEIFERTLRIAIHEGSEGFSFA